MVKILIVHLGIEEPNILAWNSDPELFCVIEKSSDKNNFLKKEKAKMETLWQRWITPKNSIATLKLLDPKIFGCE